MPNKQPSILSTDVYVRILADIILVNVSLIAAVVGIFLWHVLFSTAVINPLVAINQDLKTFTTSAILLSITSIIVFSCSGFYTHGRGYRSRYKAILIIQAVTASFILFGFFGYLLPNYFALKPSILLSAWIISCCTISLSRLWSVIWKRLILIDTKSTRTSLNKDPKLILVIGGAGYIGSALLPKLLKNGYKIRLFDLFVYGDSAITPFKNHKNVEIINADFRQIDKIVEAIRGVNSVIHLGAIVGDPACALNEDLTIEVNLMATRMIAEVCKGFNVERFVFASTCSVYGASNEILNEKSKLNPVSLYARSKIASEKVLMNLADESFSPVALRFGTIFGLSGRTRFDLVVNLLTAKAILDKKITVYGGDQWRPFLHVDDAAEAIMLAVKSPKSQINCEVYNVGSDESNHTLEQVAKLIKQRVPQADIVDMGYDGDKRNYQVSFNKIKNRLGFKPQYSLTDGIEQVAQAIEKGDIKDYGIASYSNVKYLIENGEERIKNRHIESVRDLIYAETTLII